MQLPRLIATVINYWYLYYLELEFNFQLTYLRSLISGEINRFLKLKGIWRLKVNVDSALERQGMANTMTMSVTKWLTDAIMRFWSSLPSPHLHQLHHHTPSLRHEQQVGRIMVHGKPLISAVFHGIRRPQNVALSPYHPLDISQRKTADVIF